jgi:hypothetical protein
MKVKYKPTHFDGECIFVSGPISTNSCRELVSDTERERNVQRATDISRIILLCGNVPYVPHWDYWANKYLETQGRALSADTLMGVDLFMIPKCDSMFRIAPSAGSNIERGLAKRLGKRIYYKLSDIPNYQILVDRIKLDYLNGGMTTDEIGKSYGLSGRRIRYILAKNSIPTRTVGYKKTTVTRTDAFDNLTEESSYWIGFLMADGYVSQTRYGTKSVKLGLSADDRDHILKFKEFLGTTAKVVDYRNPTTGYRSSQLTVYDSHLVSELERYGVVPHKTFIAKAPTCLLKNRDFWRGLFDGDGSITFRSEYPMLKMCGSESLVNQFLEFAREYAPSCGSHVYKKSSIFAVDLAGNYACEVAKALYEDSKIHLERKYQRYLKVQEWSDARTKS